MQWSLFTITVSVGTQLSGQNWCCSSPVGAEKKSAAGSFLIKRNLDGSASSRKRRHFGRLSKFFANIVAPSPLTNDFDDYGDKLNKEVFVGREKNGGENEFWRVLRRGRNILDPVLNVIKLFLWVTLKLKKNSKRFMNGWISSFLIKCQVYIISEIVVL